MEVEVEGGVGVEGVEVAVEVAVEEATTTLTAALRLLVFVVLPVRVKVPEKA